MVPKLFIYLFELVARIPLFHIEELPATKLSPRLQYDATRTFDILFGWKFCVSSLRRPRVLMTY